MPIITTNTISLLVLDADLHVALITATPLATRARHITTIERFTEARPDRLSAALNPLPRNAAAVLTLPSAMIALRPIAISSARWASARAELEQSVARLLPFDPGDALLGLIDRINPQRTDAASQPSSAHDRSAYLLGCSRAAANTIIIPLEEALGRPITRVQTIHHALLGLGLQRTPRAILAEQTSRDSTVHHTLALGLVESLAEPASAAAEPPTHALPDAHTPTTTHPVSPLDLATAAAIAPRTAPAAFHPLAGRTPSPLRDWIAPAACIALALTLSLAASRVTEARWSAAADSLEAQTQAREADLARLNATRAELERIHARLRAAETLTTGWRSVLPDLAAAREVLPDGSIFHSVSLTPESITIAGEAPLASEVLQRLEASPAFASAAMQGSATRAPDREAEQFTITARRESAKSPQKTAVSTPTEAAR